MKLDWHSLIHLFGSFWLVHFFALFTDIYCAAMIAFGLGIAWELLDRAFAGWWIFDPRGFEWEDIVVDLAGCVMGILF